MPDMRCICLWLINIIIFSEVVPRVIWPFVVTWLRFNVRGSTFVSGTFTYMHFTDRVTRWRNTQNQLCTDGIFCHPSTQSWVLSEYMVSPTLNKPKSRQVYTNDGIITQKIINAAVSTCVEFKTNTKKLYFCEHLISTRCFLHPGYQI